MSTAESRMCMTIDHVAHAQTIQTWRNHVVTQRGGEHFLDNEAAFTADALGWLRKRSEEPATVLLTGLYAGFPLGIASARIEPSASEALTAVVDLILVDPEARGVGIGEAMMGLLAVWATDMGCSSLEANALPGDRNTKNFFESNSMKARLLTLSTKLS